MLSSITLNKTKKIHKKDRAAVRQDLRLRIIEVTIHLLDKGGREAVTLRSVCEASDIQAPTLYRIFKDMRALLDAVAEQGILRAIHSKNSRKPSDDPVKDLRIDWERHIEFGLKNPAIYSLIFGEPRPNFVSPATEEARRLLRVIIHRIAVSGRLKISETRAFHLVYATASGVVLTLLDTPKNERNTSLAKDALEAVIDAITTKTPLPKKTNYHSAAIALRASIADLKSLSSGEQHLLKEFLERISDQP